MSHSFSCLRRTFRTLAIATALSIAIVLPVAAASPSPCSVVPVGSRAEAQRHELFIDLHGARLRVGGGVRTERLRSAIRRATVQIWPSRLVRFDVIVNGCSTLPDDVGDLKPLLKLLRRAPASNEVRAMWGGGGLTLVGHLSMTERRAVRAVAEVAEPSALDSIQDGIVYS